MIHLSTVLVREIPGATNDATAAEIVRTAVPGVIKVHELSGELFEIEFAETKNRGRDQVLDALAKIGINAREYEPPKAS